MMIPDWIVMLLGQLVLTNGDLAQQLEKAHERIAELEPQPEPGVAAADGGRARTRESHDEPDSA